MAPANLAAWQSADKAPELEVKEAPYTSPAEHEILVKNGAIAINLIDWALQSKGTELFAWVTHPQIFGDDIAGEVVEVGPGVTRFKPGDRVVAHAINIINNNPAEGGFQLYTIVSEHMASPIPTFLSYEQACVLPLGVSTAACSLYQKDHLALKFPVAPAPPSTGETLLVWGGASSVGCCAVQLARASGYEVFSVASPKNFDLLKKLGASQVFDYHSESTANDIIAAFAGKACAGAFAAVTGSLGPCAEIVSKVSGKKFVSSAVPIMEDLPEGVGSKFVFGGDLRGNEVGPAIYVDFLGKALADRSFICAPEPVVVGKGLESIQEALNFSRKGLSAQKPVVSL